MTIAQYSLGLIGTMLSWVLMSHFGRRTLYITGLTGLTIALFTIGILGCFENEATKGVLGWVIGSMLLLYTFICE